MERLERLERALVFHGANHVQVNVHQTAMQVLVGFDRSSMIAVFPECALPVLALVVFLRGAASD